MDRNEFDRKVKENPGNDKVRTRRKVQDIIENTLIEDIEENKEDSSFDEWLDTFIEEKGIDLDEIFSIESNGEIHYFELGNVIENIKATSKEEAVKITQTLNEDEIRWLAEKEGMPGKYLITLVEVQ